MPLKWKALEVEELGEHHDETAEVDVCFGFEVLDGDYQVKNGQIVFSNSQNEVSGKKKQRAENIKLATNEETSNSVLKTASREPKPKKLKLAKETSNENSSNQMKKKAETKNTFDEEISLSGMDEWEILDLHPLLLKGLKKLGFSTPTPIQKLCIPEILATGRDVLGVAETGSGKTLAYGLPILSALLKSPVEKNSGLPALILTPTRELALQITDHLRKVLSLTPLDIRPRIEAIVGGISEQKQERLLSNRPEIVVATIGRFRAWISEHEHLKNLKTSLKFLVLDEADRLTDIQHFADIAPFIHHMTCETEEEKKLTKKRQTLLFSATLLSKEDERERKKKLELSKRKKRNIVPTGPVELMALLGRRGKPKVCSVFPSSDISASIEEPKESMSNKQQAKISETKPSKDEIKLPDSMTLFRFDCTTEDKEAFLHWIIASSDPGSAILVFVNTISATKRIAGTVSLSFPKCVISTLHANMEQKQRLRNLDKFRGEPASNDEGKKSDLPTRIMIASDVAARGLDIPNVDNVIHYGIPKRTDVFVHRSGRCGRAGRLGTVYALCSGLENKEMGKIQFAILPKEIHKHSVNELELKSMMTRVQVCQKLHRLISEKATESFEKSWKKRAAKEAEIEVDSDYDEGDDEAVDITLNQALARHQKSQAKEQLEYEISILKKQLNRLINVKFDQKLPGQMRRGRKRMK